MAEKQNENMENNKPEVWKIIGMFAMVFLAVQLVISAFSLGVNFLMRQVGAGENAQIFVGSTISRIGMIAAGILITAPVIRVALKKKPGEILFPLKKNWTENLSKGVLAGSAGILFVFILSLLFGWIRISGLALSGEPAGVWLRTTWLAILVNATAAVIEEVLFRGFLVTGLKEAWDEKGAVFVSAVIFGASHLLAASARNSNWLEFIPLLAIPGVLLGWVYLRTGNLWLPVGLHFAWNLFQDDILNLTGKISGDTIFGFMTAVRGPGWMMGTDFGIELGGLGIIAAASAALVVWLVTNNNRTGAA